MLILTRKVDQGIVISGNIHVRVLGVQRDRVKIGISAPKEIIVLRDELIDGDRTDDNATDVQERSMNSHDEHILEIDIGDTEPDDSEREVGQPSES